MSGGSPQPPARFPWGYFAAALLPAALLAGVYLLPTFVSPENAFGYGMLGVMLVGPVASVVTICGAVRLARGDAVTFPALRLLVWITAVLAVVAFVFG